jgi:hypothetical protein
MRLENEKTIFNFLYISDPPEFDPSPDLIAGFGHFDMAIPARCADLYGRYSVPVLFTGGIGSGTADLGRPEALAFQEEFFSLLPQVNADQVLVESASTNTSENVRFSIDCIARSKGADFLDRIRTISLVASPYRQRRVFLTCRKYWPDKRLLNHPPRSTFTEEWVKFASMGLDLGILMRGELERLTSYADNGWIERLEIPAEVLAAAREPG